MRALLLLLAVACASPAPRPTDSGKPISADEAAGHAGESVTVEFVIGHVGQSKDSTFLNANRFGRDGFVGFIPANAKAGFQQAFGDDLIKALEGKKVQITGRIKTYKGNPEMVLASPDQLKIIP